MPLIERLRDPEFWAHYTFAIESGPGHERLGALRDRVRGHGDYEAVFAVGGGHALTLRVSVRFGTYELGVIGPGDERPAELGWVDMAHPWPYALRWAELETVCRAVAAHEPGAWPPGAPMALLCSFAAVFDDDDVDAALAAVDAAYAGLRPAGWTGYWPRGDDWLPFADFRGRGVTWHRDAAGNAWADADDDAYFYSFRLAPHAGLARLMAALAQRRGPGESP
nr:hypothetical protein GCM10020063_049000 [Dactylosporangium thailandense]